MSDAGASVRRCRLGRTSRSDRVSGDRPAADRRRPLVVFLHEGLGSLCDVARISRDGSCDVAAARTRLLAARLRPSTPRAAGERWNADYHAPTGARGAARAVRDALGRPMRAVALRPQRRRHDRAALRCGLPARGRAALVVLAPHLFVEDVSVASIAAARDAYVADRPARAAGALPRRRRPTFWGWNDIWLDPAFRDWNIEAELRAIRCPVLAVQGAMTSYGTLAQIRGIAAALAEAPACSSSPDCGHSPHRDQPPAMIAASAALIADLPRH